jgi:hypothetical protein
VSLAVRRCRRSPGPPPSATCARLARVPATPAAPGTTTGWPWQDAPPAPWCSSPVGGGRRGRPSSGRRLLALDTGFENEAAQALYAKLGFAVRGQARAPDAETTAALGGSGFISYSKRL